MIEKWTEAWHRWWPWVMAGLATFVVFLTVSAWNRAHNAEESLAKALEAEKLRSAGFLAELEVSKSDMKKAADDLLVKNLDLMAEVERLKTEVGKVKVVQVVHVVTKPAGVYSGAAPRPCPTGPDPASAPQCVLAQGDTGHVAVDSLTMETKKGNHVIIGKAACYRDTPEPATLLFSGTFSGPLSTALSAPAAKPKRWGAGVFAGVGKSGGTVGPAIAFPPVSVFGWFQTELTAGVGVSASGSVQAAATGIARW